MVCWALAVAMSWLGKVTLGGVKDKGEVCAVPVRGTDCGLPVALSAMVRLAVRPPVLVGLKITAMVHFAPAFTCVPQVLVSEKSWGSTPVMEMRVILNLAFPVLVSVTFFGLLLCPSVTLPKSKRLGERLTAACADAREL